MNDEQVDRAAEYRDLRRRLEEAVQPLATSVDGRAFELQARLHGLDLEVGGYVVLETGSATYLGQVLTLELGHLESAEFTLTVEGTEGSMRAPVSVRAARGTGVVLDGPAPPFLDARVAPADDAAIEAWIGASDPASTAVLTIGTLLAGPEPAGPAGCRRVRPAHLPVRAVGFGQDLLPRPGPRAAAGPDRSADDHPRSQLRLREDGPTASRRRPGRGDRAVPGGRRRHPGPPVQRTRRAPAPPALRRARGGLPGRPAPARPGRGR